MTLMTGRDKPVEEVLRPLKIPAAEFYSFSRLPYQIWYSPAPVRDLDRPKYSDPLTSLNLQKAMELLSREGYRLPTLAELEVLGERGISSGRTFPDGTQMKEDAFELTCTTLRRPRFGKKKYTTKDGESFFVRILYEGDNEVGEVLVPEGQRALYVSKLGLPLKTANHFEIMNRLKQGKGVLLSGTQFQFDPKLEHSVLVRGPYEPITSMGPDDVAVDPCTIFLMNMPYSAGAPDLVIRPVKGDLPNYEHHTPTIPDERYDSFTAIEKVLSNPRLKKDLSLDEIFIKAEKLAQEQVKLRNFFRKRFSNGESMVASGEELLSFLDETVIELAVACGDIVMHDIDPQHTLYVVKDSVLTGKVLNTLPEKEGLGRIYKD